MGGPDLLDEHLVRMACLTPLQEQLVDCLAKSLRRDGVAGERSPLQIELILRSLKVSSVKRPGSRSR